MTSVYFSPNGGVQAQLVAIIDSAKNSIDLAIYSFTAQNIFNSLVSAIKRGVTVRAVFDKSETTKVQAGFHDQLEQLGVAIKLLSPSGGIMHNKYLIVDDSLLEWGSYNYTNRAELDNRENATFTTDPDLIAKYKANFESIFSAATLEDRSVLRGLKRFIRALSYTGEK
jgi:phosphatidylserine/phosphatidylglycerophosphate/cardiolipin synthase-like enzyme